jgi:hypothetical protein
MFFSLIRESFFFFKGKLAKQINFTRGVQLITKAGVHNTRIVFNQKLFNFFFNYLLCAKQARLSGGIQDLQ